MDNRSIGVYDSGIGGLTVFEKLYKLLPNENFIYFGDTANVPYGTKTKEELLVITHKIMDFFAKRNVKSVVMACNTTSAVAYDTLKNDYNFKLYPLIQTACKKIAETGAKKIGVLSTEATANSHAYKINIQKFDENIKVFEHGCPKKWVEMVENHTQNLPENFDVIKNNLDILLAEGVDKIVLGCTHYPYLKNILVEITGRDIFIDPSVFFAESICDNIQMTETFARQKLREPEFFVSSSPEKFVQSAEIFYKLTDLPTLI